MQNKLDNLETIANEFGFDGHLRVLFSVTLKRLHERKQLLKQQGYNAQQLRNMYLTQYELAEQIYGKKDEIEQAIKTQRRFEIKISRT